MDKYEKLDSYDYRYLFGSGTSFNCALYFFNTSIAPTLCQLLREKYLIFSGIFEYYYYYLVIYLFFYNNEFSEQITI